MRSRKELPTANDIEFRYNGSNTNLNYELDRLKYYLEYKAEKSKVEDLERLVDRLIDSFIPCIHRYYHRTSPPYGPSELKCHCVKLGEIRGTEHDVILTKDCLDCVVRESK